MRPEGFHRAFEYAFGLPAEEMPDKVIVTPFFPEKYFTSICDNIRYEEGRLFRGGIFNFRGSDIGLVRLDRAVYLAGDAVLMLGLSGVTEAVFLNTCGHIEANRTGKVVIPDKCFEAESFSEWHRPGRTAGDILDSLQIFEVPKEEQDDFSVAAEKRLGPDNVQKGTNLTIGSVMAENPDLIRALEKRGVISVDMEFSKVLSAAKKTNIKTLVAAMVVSDSLTEGKFYRKLDKSEKKRFNSACRVMSEVALMFLSSATKKKTKEV